MSILGIDVGTKRIGVAVSDELNLMAHPVGTLAAEPKDSLSGRLQEIVKEKSVQEVVVGMPVNMNGCRGEKAEQAAEFIEWLEQRLRLPVCRRSSRLAECQFPPDGTWVCISIPRALYRLMAEAASQHTQRTIAARRP